MQGEFEVKVGIFSGTRLLLQRQERTAAIRVVGPGCDATPLRNDGFQTRRYGKNRILDSHSPTPNHQPLTTNHQPLNHQPP